MEIISLQLQTKEQLCSKEAVPEIPALIVEYLASPGKSSLRDEGNFFRVEIEGDSKVTASDGIARLNELRVEKRWKKGWETIFTTGMLQYRGAYSWEIDNDDLSFSDVLILEESAEKALIAYRTGAGNIKIYSFTDKGNSQEEIVFNINEYGKQQTRLTLINGMINDEKLFVDYARRSLSGRWHCNDDRIHRTDEMSVMLATHASRNFDAVTDYYKFFVLIKGKGIAVSEEISSGIANMTSKFCSTTVSLREIKPAAAEPGTVTAEILLRAFCSYPTGVTFGGNDTDWKRQYQLLISIE